MSQSDQKVKVRALEVVVTDRVEGKDVEETAAIAAEEDHAAGNVVERAAAWEAL